ncbi:bifunctional RNase H/acid phosphatase [Actinophytocola xinjiangensis]|uniref:Bifunctional RNase H/acid phosphatase n=1 Tax=Actinophytocola xinjiangensis TaxID=485602 RepID=A0A7Z0WRD1_9PSEU|nr:bifunctional RNase H/acid phosphatase [Actinophytocola xinjiangensis]OLF11208.1 bifunctional RNase H/acid phosphatase [Actinophytocola xinjiangensis]
MIVEADGGSRGNPGPAGYGAVVFDAGSGDVLAEDAEGLGVTTNNVAEYQGLLAGLRAARRLGASAVEVRMDSKLVVEQMSGRWQVKHPALKPLVVEARELAGGFDRITYQWIPRASNAHADRLANEAMDAQAGNPGKAERAHRPATSAQGRTSADTAEVSELLSPSPQQWTGATGTPTRLLLLRHGQTELSVDRRYSGRGDVPLTALGERQAKAAGQRLAGIGGIDAATPVVVSPLGRARQTADAVVEATGGQAVVHDGLTETDFGSWERLTFGEAAARDPELHARWLADPAVPAPDGESFDAVHRRVRRARDELIARYGGADVIVVSHVTPIKSLLRMGLDAGPALLHRLHLDLASLSVVEFYPDGHASVRLVNDTSHLSAP